MRWLALAIAAWILSANEARAVTIVTGGILESTTWTIQGSPYFLNGDVWVQSRGPGYPIPVLTIDPGVTVTGGGILYVGYSYPGNLKAVGTASQRIAFTSTWADPTLRGRWPGIVFGAQASTASMLKYCTVSGAGMYSGGYLPAAGILVRSPVSFENVTVTSSGGHGFFIEDNGAAPFLKNVTVSDNTGAGIAVASGATPRLEGVSAVGNGQAGIVLEPDVTLASATGLSATGNGVDGIEISHLFQVTFASSSTWKATSLPYVIRSKVWIRGSGSPTLTIEPGTAVKFSGTGELWVGTDGDSTTASLQAVGTDVQRIEFTAGSCCAGVVHFSPRALASSRISFANFTSVGLAGGGAITVNSASPSIENVTLKWSAGAGIRISNTAAGASANPLLTNVTLVSNSGAGLRIERGATASISGLTATGNAGPAISQDVSTTLASATGLIATNNGINGIELRDGCVYVPTTWKRTDIPYFATGNVCVAEGGSNGTLAIAPGVTVRFSPGKGLDVGYGVPGLLSAVGTETLPIVLTSNAPSPAPGAWRGISFANQAMVSSALRWARVEWAGSGGAGILIQGASPTLEKVTVSGSSGKGISITGAASNVQLIGATISGNLGGGISIDGGTAQVSGSTISGNTGYGIRVASGSPVVTSTWVNATVAGAAGSGDGVELLGGSASFSLYTTSNNEGSGVRVSGGVGHRIQNGLIMGNASGLVSSIPASQVNARFNNWDSPLGPSGSGFGSGQSVSGGAFFDPWLTASPNSNQYYRDTAIVGPRFNPLLGVARWDLTSILAGTWTLKVRDASQIVVRTLVASGTTASLTWDGKNDAGVAQPDGTYTYSLANVSAGGAIATPANGRLYVDSSLRVELTSPSAGQTLSNVYSNGDRVFPIVGSASMSQLSGWTLEYGSGSAPTSWTTLASGTSSVLNGTLATWDTKNLPNGPYSLRLSGSDTFGSQFVSTLALTVGHFDMASNKWEFNPRSGESVAYSSVVPFRVWMSLTIKNAGGHPVRTFPIGYRDAGSYVDAWDGRAETSAILPDGLYSFMAEVTDGPHSLTYDLSNEKMTLGTFQYFDDLADPSFATLDPFNGRPLTFTYQPNAPGRSTVIFSTKPQSQGAITGSCSTPTEFCLLDGSKWQSSQQQRIVWAGIDNDRRYRSDIRQVGVVIAHDDFPRNGVVVYGSPTNISNLALSPRRIRPGVESMQVDFDLVLPSGESRDVFVEFVNQESLDELANPESISPLRTLTLPLRSTGHVTASWDGRSDDGMMVAEGTYLVRAWTVDRSGNRASADHMTRLEY